MRNLLSYDFRNIKRDFIKLGLIFIIASLLVHANVLFLVYQSKENLSGVLPVLSILIFGIIGVAFFIGIIFFYGKLANILKRDIYDKQAYITFSLPVTEKQIIKSKLIIGYVMLIAISLIILIINVGFGYLDFLYAFDWNMNQVNSIFSSAFNLTKDLISKKGILALLTIIEYLVSGFYLLGLIFFAIILDWLTSKTKKSSYMWVVYFLAISTLITLVLEFVITGGLNWAMTGRYIIENNSVFSAKLTIYMNTSQIIIVQLFRIGIVASLSYLFYYLTAKYMKKSIEI